MRRADITQVFPASTCVRSVTWKIPVESLTSEAAEQLISERGGLLTCALQALFRRRHRLISVPQGSFALRFTCNATEDLVALDLLLEDIPRDVVPVPTTQPLIVRVDGSDTLFFRRELFAVLSQYQQEHWMMRLLSTFVMRWEEGISNVPKASIDPLFIPYEQRRKRPNGAVMRGPGWSPVEDAILQRYFGADEHGQHRLVSEERWEKLLEEFEGHRTKKAILGRISAINHRLKCSLMVDGFIPKRNLAVYLDRKLGQRQRLPNNRPRPDGTYYPPQKPKPEPRPEYLPSVQATPVPRPNNIAAAEAAATEDAVCLVNN